MEWELYKPYTVDPWTAQAVQVDSSTVKCMILQLVLHIRGSTSAHSTSFGLCSTVAYCGGGLVAKSCLTSATPWIVARQAPLSMDFSGKNTEVDCHFLLQGIFLTRDQTHVSCIAGGFFTAEPPGKPTIVCMYWEKSMFSGPV